MTRLLLVCFCYFFMGFLHAQETFFGYSPEAARVQRTVEQTYLGEVDFASFKKHLQVISAEPHVAGSEANRRVGAYLQKTMQAAGLEVMAYPYDVYMPKEPGESLVEIVSPVRKPLNQQEYILPDDPFSAHPNLKMGWNAYSGSGDVTAEVVYANYGTKADFDKLEELGISVEGKIVLARYGGNFRGYKAKFAEEKGAVGLIIFTDPGDSGYSRGLVYPEGIFYNESSVQRGSLITEPFTGDPLTPFAPALPLDGKKKIERKNPEETNLPKIPVTPIPYGSAVEIIGKMRGRAVPTGWQGGLPFTYRVEGGSDLRVRLKVNQKRDFVRIENIVGTLIGSTYPDEWVILGCHYDAWSFGATDPNSGTAMLLSLSEALGRLSQQGIRPKRSILIAHWDGEEHGVIGSAEWVEQMEDELKAKSVAYLNFDAGVSGMSVRGASSPTLKDIMVGASKAVALPNDDKTIFDAWAGSSEDLPIGNLGGGSDHIAFYMYAGIPSLSGGAGGPTLYHTNYDNLHFYEKFVDSTFQMGGTVAQWAGIMALRLANSDIIPYQPTRYAKDLQTHFETASAKIKSLNPQFEGFPRSSASITKLAQITPQFEDEIAEYLSNKTPIINRLRNINKILLQWEKSFLTEKGMPFGSWYRSLYGSTDPFSGYAAWMLPGIQYALESRDLSTLEAWDRTYSETIETLISQVEKARQSLSDE